MGAKDQYKIVKDFENQIKVFDFMILYIVRM